MGGGFFDFLRSSSKKRGDRDRRSSRKSPRSDFDRHPNLPPEYRRRDSHSHEAQSYSEDREEDDPYEPPHRRRTFPSDFWGDRTTEDRAGRRHQRRHTYDPGTDRSTREMRDATNAHGESERGATNDADLRAWAKAGLAGRPPPFGLSSDATTMPQRQNEDQRDRQESPWRGIHSRGNHPSEGRGRRPSAPTGTTEPGKRSRQPMGTERMRAERRDRYRRDGYRPERYSGDSHSPQVSSEYPGYDSSRRERNRGHTPGEAGRYSSFWKHKAANDGDRSSRDTSRPNQPGSDQRESSYPTRAEERRSGHTQFHHDRQKPAEHQRGWSAGSTQFPSTDERHRSRHRSRPTHRSATDGVKDPGGESDVESAPSVTVPQDPMAKLAEEMRKGKLRGVAGLDTILKQPQSAPLPGRSPADDVRNICNNRGVAQVSVPRHLSDGSVEVTTRGEIDTSALELSYERRDLLLGKVGRSASNMTTAHGVMRNKSSQLRADMDYDRKEEVGIDGKFLRREKSMLRISRRGQKDEIITGGGRRDGHLPSSGRRSRSRSHPKANG